MKEPFRVTVGKQGGKTILDVVGLGGSFVPAEEESEGDDGAELLRFVEPVDLSRLI